MLRSLIPTSIQPRVVICLVVIVLSTASESLGFSMVMPLLASLIGKGEKGVIADLLVGVFGELKLDQILSIVLILFLIKFFLGVARNYLMYGTEWMLRGHWMASLYEHNTIKDYSVFEREKPGLITNEITNETLKAASALRQILEYVGQVLLVISLLLVLLISNFSYTITILGVVGGILFLIKKGLLGSVEKYSWLRQKYEGTVYHEVNEMIHGMKTIRFLALEQFLLQRFQGRLDKLISLMTKTEVIKRLPMQFTEITFVALMVSGIMFAEKALRADVGTVLPFFGMLTIVSIRLFSHVGSLATNYMSIKILWPSVSTVSAAIEVFESTKNKWLKNNKHTETKCEDRVCFNKVTFHYSAGNPVLKDLDVCFSRHCFSVIVGPSGSGKSTIAKLLMKLYEPVAGDITVDGVSIASIPDKQWRQLIGYVDQEYFFFNGTVRENLTQHLCEVSEGDIDCALSMANAYEFVRDLPDGLDTNVGDKGNRLSGGQKARLAFTRALLRQPRILILDEVTSALDAKTKDYILSTIVGLRNIMTIIAITHDDALTEQAEFVYELSNHKLCRLK